MSSCIPQFNLKERIKGGREEEGRERREDEKALHDPPYDCDTFINNDNNLLELAAFADFECVNMEII